MISRKKPEETKRLVLFGYGYDGKVFVMDPETEACLGYLDGVTDVDTHFSKEGFTTMEIRLVQ